MNWIKDIKKAISYIENNITEDIDVDAVADSVYASSSNFGRIFNLVTGYTIGDYIRNRRLTLVAQEIINSKLISIRLRINFIL